MLKPLVIGVFFILVSSPSSAQPCNCTCGLEVTVNSFVVSTTDSETLPDPFLRFVVDRSQLLNTAKVTLESEVAKDQPVLSRYFEGRTFLIKCVEPFTFQAFVFDEDTLSNDLMASSPPISLPVEYLPPTCDGPAKTIPANGPSAAMLVTVKPVKIECAPALSAQGFIALSVLLVCVGILRLRRRRA